MALVNTVDELICLTAKPSATSSNGIGSPAASRWSSVAHGRSARPPPCVWRANSSVWASSKSTSSATPNSTPCSAAHEKLLGLVRRYTLTGGMPHCVQLGLDTGFNHADILKYQHSLIQTYRDDFAKYRGTQNALTLTAFFNGLLGQVGQQFSHKQAHEIASGSSGDNRQLNTAIEHFIAARLFYRVLHSQADAIPLGAETKIRISKFLFIDIGLLLAAQGIPAQSLMHSALELANRGLLAEQFVGQQLLAAKPAYCNPELYYWQPPRVEGQAEIDFLYTLGNEIIPVEVKAGSGGTIKSLHTFVIKKQAARAIRISSAKPSVDKLEAKLNLQRRPFQLFNVPFYLVNRLEQLLASK